MAFWNTTYWSDNYWNPQYYNIPSVGAPAPTPANEYWGTRYWASNYWGDNYWALTGAGTPPPPPPPVDDTGELVRMFCFGVDPDAGLNTMYAWDLAADQNTAGKSITNIYIPKTKGSSINIVQETMFLGGLNLTRMYQTFREDLGRDEDQAFRAEWLSQMLAPTLAANAPLDTIRVTKIEFPHINPLEKGIDIRFVKEAVEPHKNPTSYTPLDWTSPNSIAGFPSGVAKWIHLRGIDDTQQTGVAIFDGFVLHFYRLSSTQGDDD